MGTVKKQIPLTNGEKWNIIVIWKYSKFQKRKTKPLKAKILHSQKENEEL